MNKDLPIELRTTTNWESEGDLPIESLLILAVKVWDIIEELLNTAIQPPTNPFKIDFTKLMSLPIMERTLNTIGLVNLLRKIAVKQTPYKTLGKSIEALMLIC